jgi:hypothetical protein
MTLFLTEATSRLVTAMFFVTASTGHNGRPQGAPDSDAIVRFNEAMINVTAPQIRQDHVEHGLLLRELITDSQRAIPRCRGRFLIKQKKLFHN